VVRFGTAVVTLETYTSQEQWLTNVRHPKFGLERVAILYSLPLSCLQWGYVSKNYFQLQSLFDALCERVIYFLTAFFFACLSRTSTVTRALVGIMAATMLSMFIWMNIVLDSGQQAWCSRFTSISRTIRDDHS